MKKKKIVSLILIMLIMFQSTYISDAKSTYTKKIVWTSEDSGYIEVKAESDGSHYPWWTSMTWDTYLDYGKYTFTKLIVTVPTIDDYTRAYVNVNGTEKAYYYNNSSSDSSYWRSGKTYDFSDYNFTSSTGYNKNKVTIVLGANYYAGLGGYTHTVKLYFKNYTPPPPPPNDAPIVSITQPTNNSQFTKYQKPQIKYNVYDINGDEIEATTSYYNGDAWVNLDYRNNLYNGDSVTLNIPDIDWNSMPFNLDIPIKIDIKDITGHDNQLTASQEIKIRKINRSSSAIINSPSNGATLKSNQNPSFQVKVNDSDGDSITATLQYNNNGTWTNITSKSNLANGETTSLKASDTFWRNLNFNTPYSYRIRTFDGMVYSYTSAISVSKSNTAPSVAILKPINNEKFFAGYLPFTWSISDIDYDNVNLKIWTDTPNVVNNGVFFDGSIGSSPYQNNNLFKVFLSEGQHKIYFRFSDGYNTNTYTRTITIEDMVDIHVNDNETFYIPIFNKEKSDIYYKNINNMLDSNKYMFNILELPENQNYINNVDSIQNVTGDSNLTDNGDRIYNTNGEFSVSKIADWILSRLSSDSSPIIKVFPVGSIVRLKNIEFFDEDQDFTTISPEPRGKDRQFLFKHYPQFYENADSEIMGNGNWIKDSLFTIFDGNSIEREGQDIKIEINKAGRYLVSAKESDSSYNYSGVDFSKESEPKQIEIYTHRYPKAIANYKDNGNGTIKLLSKSYDMDFETRVDKGIQEETWQYRIVGYDGSIINDWRSVSNTSSFTPNSLHKTDVRLKVKDYGARIDLVNDGELTDTDILTIDATGQPPVADFLFKVGSTLLNSVVAEGEVYKGNVGHETIQLDSEYTLWNDFFAPSISRVITWSKNQNQLNTEINTLNTLSTTLTVTNKYSLTNSISKSIGVKDININNNSTSSVIAGKIVDFDINLVSSKVVNKWGNFKVTITSSNLGYSNKEVTNTFSNRFELRNIDIPDTLADSLDYTIRVYSKRTGELLTQNNYSINIETPIDIEAAYQSSFPSTNIPSTEPFNLINIKTEAPIDIVDLNMSIYINSTRARDIKNNLAPLITKNMVTDVINKNGDEWDWKDINNYQVPLISDGSYTIKIIATAKNGVTNEWVKSLNVNTPINLTPLMPGEISTNNTTDIRATTSKYANTLTVTLYEGEDFETTMNLSGTISGLNKNWTRSYDVPETIPEGTYTARFTARTPNGKVETETVSFKVNTLKISGSLLPVDPMAGDELIFNITTEGYAERLELILEDDVINNDERQEMGYDPVSYPVIIDLNEGQNVVTTEFRYIVWCTTPQSLTLKGDRLRAPYTFKVRAWKGSIYKDVEFVTELQGDIRQLIKFGVTGND